jgi:site-specific DNA recombinase
MRVVLYGRVSGRKQKEQDTIESQKFHLRQWAEAGGHEVVGEYWDEAVSNSVPLADRPDGGRLLRELPGSQPDAVVAYKSGRFSRVPEVFHDGRRLLVKAGVDLLFLRDDLKWGRASERFASGVHLLVTAWGREDLLENLKDGAHAAAQAGFYTGGVVPLGYRVADLPVPGKRSRRVLVIDEEEATVVRLVYRLLAEEGLSSVQVAAYLNERRIPTATANQQNGHRSQHNGRAATTGLWTAQHVVSLVRNPCFKGVRTWGNREVPCPAIVSEETWNAACAQLDRNRRGATRNGKRSYLLTGLVKCVSCGRTYTGLARAFNTSRERRWYRCSGAWEADQGWRPISLLCPVPMVPAEPLEAMVWDLVVERVSRFEETLDKLARTQAQAAGDEATTTKRKDSLLR